MVSFTKLYIRGVILIERWKCCVHWTGFSIPCPALVIVKGSIKTPSTDTITQGKTLVLIWVSARVFFIVRYTLL